MSPTSAAEPGAPTVLVRLEPRLLSDLVAWPLTRQGVHAVVCRTHEPALDRRAPRCFDVAITSAGLPHGVEADVVISVPGTLASAGESVDVWGDTWSRRVIIDDLGDLAVLALACLQGHADVSGATLS